MNKFSGFYLMLKQGIKGVFKFKAQFTIILILSFVATFILSVSLSTQRRMTDSYNKIVKKVDRFDYQGNIQLDSTANATSDLFILSNEINNSDSTLLEKWDFNDKGVQVLVSSEAKYNFILSNVYNDSKDANSDSERVFDNFMTKAVDSDEAKSYFNKENFDIHDKNTVRKTLFNLTKLFEKSIFNELIEMQNNYSQVKSNIFYSSIGQYTIKNKDWFVPFLNLNANNQIESIKTGISNLNVNEEYKGIFNNVIMSIAKIGSWMYQVLNIYAPNDITGPDAYSFLFGKSHEGNDKDKTKNWIVDKNNGVLPYSLNVSNQNKKSSLKNKHEELTTKDDFTLLKSSKTNSYLKTNEEENENELIKDVAKQGLRGITNPFVDFNAQNINDFNSIKDFGFNTPLTMVKSNKSIYEQAEIFREFYNYNDVNVEDIVGSSDFNSDNKTTYFLYDQKMAAVGAGFDFKIRRESTFFDSTKQIKYRGIIMDDRENYNLHVLKGRLPSNQEILISEQFAKKNKVKIGSVVKFGDARFVISGIATDALSFMPSQDLLNPIPNPKVSSFIYASKNTIEQMGNGSLTSDKSKGSITQNYSYFLWNKENEESKDSRKDQFLATLFNDESNSRNNFKNIKNYLDNSNKNTSFGDTSSNLSVSEFKKSEYRYSWTLQPLIFRIYSIITYVASAIIAIIAIIALVVCVKKTINLNSKQIGILKAMGESPGLISVSYISYSMIITFIIIPLAWLTGIFTQIPFANMFITYMSAQPNLIYFDWISLVIAIVALGVFSAIIAFISAYSLTNTSVIKILVSSVKWGKLPLLDKIKNTMFKNAKFSKRFSLTLTSSGSRQIVLMTVVVFITALLINISLAIPSVAIKVNDSYYKSIKYSNKYDQQSLTSNSPLSKNVISFWEGHDQLDSNYIDGKLQLDDTNNRYGYYDDVNSYTASISGANVVSPYVYSEKEGIKNSYLYILQNNTNLLQIISSMFGNNFYQNYGNAFSVGMVDEFFGLLLHSYENIFDGVTTHWEDEDKFTSAQQLSSWLTSSIPKIIGAIVNENSGGGSGSGSEGNTQNTWKEEIMSQIYKVIPSYVKAYVQKSDSRLDQYAIAYQNDLYIPNKETFTTNVDGEVGNKSINLTGLDKYQDSVVIDKNTKEKAYLSDDIKQKVIDILNNEYTSNEDISYKGMKIYNAATNTVTLPVIANKQAESAYSLEKGNKLTNWTNKNQKIQFNGINGWVDLPKNAWIYDDTSYHKFVESDANKKHSFIFNDEQYEVKNNKYYLDPYSLDNNKITLNRQYDNEYKDDINLKEVAYAFSDWKKDKDNNIVGAYARPFYQFKDVKLMIPESILNVNNFLWSYDQSKDGKKNTTNWYRKNVANSEIPESVKKAWETKGVNATGTFLIINPYDISYYKDDIYDNSAELTNLLDGPAYWYNGVIKGAEPQMRMQKQEDRYYDNKTVKIDIQSVGTIDSYNDKLVVIDSDFANEMLGYSNSRTYQYNYNVFDKTQTIKANKQAEDGTISQFNRWKLKDYNKDMNVSNVEEALWMPSSYSYDEGTTALDYAPHRWYNGKLSNDDEATELTTQVSFKGLDSWAQSSINLGTPAGSLYSIIAGSHLLSESKALIKQVSMLAIAIGAMLMIAIIITASLLIMLTGDIYIAQYQRFMVLMRALGYSNTKIITYTFGTVSIISFAAWVAGTILAWGLIFIGVTIMWNSGLAIPAGITWWPIIGSLLIMALSYVGSLYVSSGKARKENPSVLLTATAD